MKHSFLLLVVLLCSFSMYAQTTRCIAITAAGTQCTRKAVLRGYCKQHYGIKTNKQIPRKPRIDLPEEWPAISTNSTKPDIMIAWRDPLTNIIHIGFKH